MSAAWWNMFAGGALGMPEPCQSSVSQAGQTSGMDRLGVVSTRPHHSLILLLVGSGNGPLYLLYML
jgi:hypothetical protein